MLLRRAGTKLRSLHGRWRDKTTSNGKRTLVLDIYMQLATVFKASLAAEETSSPLIQPVCSFMNTPVHAVLQVQKNLHRSSLSVSFENGNCFATN